MPRRHYIADLKKAAEGVSIAGVSSIKNGDNDGEFTFMCSADGKQYKLLALIPEVSDYPSAHMYMLIGPDDAPQSVADALSGIADSAAGKTIEQMLELTSRKLDSTDEDGDQQMLDSQDYRCLAEEDSDEDVEEYFPDDDDVQKPFSMPSSVSREAYGYTSSEFRKRIRSDLRTAKAAGFKVGYLGGLVEGGSCYVSVSCRIAKLGISEEAMQAWQVRPSEYLVVIMSYPNGYKNMSDMEAFDNITSRRQFGVRIGICTTYKPTMHEAIQAFAQLSREEELMREKKQKKDAEWHSEDASVPKGFRNSFISHPLHDLMENRFPQLLKFRYNGMSWNGAEEFYHDSLGAHKPSDLGLADKYMSPEALSTAYPSLVTADHITDTWTGQDHSLPLVTMQFVLRHFVRCTEFCLICFRKMSDDLQAIKPYVCEEPLCLYQYMSLGFGPSIEHEILSQSKVVDLLISFCHTSAMSGKLKDFPAGLSLMVPPTAAYGNDYPSMVFDSYPYARPSGSEIRTTPVDIQNVQPGAIRYNAVTHEIMFDSPEPKCPFKVGDWIVIRSADKFSKAMHCRIGETFLYPTITVAEPVEPTTSQVAAYATVSPALKTTTPDKSAPVRSEFKPYTFYMYDRNFDSLSESHKREAIFALLDLIPSVNDMKQYLLRKNQSTLSSWVNRFSPAALGLLRWIIASNRACIMQVNEDQERLWGMPGWTQFRFAMGAPDKERRFIQAVRDTSNRLHLRHPTLFAWHGSPLPNWHSIIREGLHFRDTANGRAYGHGVYHSLDINTSLGYTNLGGGSNGWAMSDLKISSAVALNEIVNAPNEYVSKAPHLVVAQLDWIQTRYLFVQTRSETLNSHTTTNNSQEVKPANPIKQDDSYTPRGVGGPLIIPWTAISSQRGSSVRTVDKPVKRRKTSAGASVANPINLDADDDNFSVATLEDDRRMLEDADLVSESEDFDTGIITPVPSKGKNKAKASSGLLSKIIGSKSSAPVHSSTDYIPGKLDYSQLSMLAQPAWATPSATRRLMQDFKSVIAIQKNVPLHELGWHIDEDMIENMYQWIIELHSFDPTLPLAQDMAKKSVTSIVLEMRFGKDYPMSPPFVRVIRPRFLGFQQGGGGHVTAGGAMCMELLTNNGWSAVSTIESVLLQVRMAMSSLDPKPARLDTHGRVDYGIGEAVDAYIRACNVHGWTVPSGFREMALGGASVVEGNF